MSKSRVLDKSGWQIWDGKTLARFLNDTDLSGSAWATRRMVAIVEKTQSLRTFLAKSTPRNHRKFWDCVFAVNDVLPKRAELGVIVTKDDDIQFRWGPMHTTPAHLALSVAVNSFVAVVADGDLDKLKRCNLPSCRRWYFASFPHQAFCVGRGCKEKHWRSTKEGRKKYNDYMRGYYQRNLKSLRSRKGKNK